MRIKATVERIPGGMMTVPLISGALVATFTPGMGRFFGSFTSALFTGALSMLAVFYVCIGATISVRSLPSVIKRGGTLLASRIALGIGVGFLVGRLLGTQPIASGWFAGLSTLAMVAAINDTNGGLYMTLMQRYGSAEEAASYSMMALESGPFFTMVSLGVAGLSSFPWQTFAGAILPLCVGMLLGNLDPEMRSFLGQAVPVLIPFFAFALGTSMDLHRVWTAGLLGILLCLFTMTLSAAVLIVVDKLIGGNGTAGIAASATAGNAAAVPMLVAAANSEYSKAAQSATLLVASSVVLSSVLTPPLTSLWHRWATRQHVSGVEG
jgi:2-keto-3-deoxygluconate permease